jgi:cytochrome c oxidase assembly protein subunit 15
MWLWGIAGIVALQFLLGVATLMSVVEINLAVAHQVAAFVLAGAIIAYIADLSRLRR